MDIPRKRIVIFGATGDIGSQLSKYLARHNHTVTAITRLGDKAFEKAHKIFSKTNVAIAQVDIWNTSEVRELCLNADIIINCLGVLKNKIKSDQLSYTETLAMNSVFPGFLAQNSHNKPIILISTNSVYDIPREQIQIIETYYSFLLQILKDITKEQIGTFNNFIYTRLSVLPTPIVEHLYAVSKYLGERLMNDFAKESVCGRLTNIFGPGYSLKRTIPKIIYNRLKGDRIDLKNNSRNYIYVADIGRIISHFIHNPPTTRIICNFDTQKYVTLKDLVKRINFYTPTGYGQVIVQEEDRKVFTPLLDKSAVPYIGTIYKKPFISFEEALRKTIYHVQEKIVRTMENNRDVSFFIHSNEELVKSMFGSSSAQVLLLKKKDSGTLFIRKIAMRRGVEGNGYPKLRSEHDFLIRIRRDYPKLYELYPKVLYSRNFDTSFSLDYEYIEGGISAYKALSTGLLAPHQFMSHFTQFFSKAVNNGYLNKTIRIKKKDALKEGQNFYLHRAEYRLKGLEQNRYAVDFMTSQGFSFSKILNAHSINVNGKEYLNTRTIMREINRNKRLLDLLAVEKNHFCVHGDLTFLNMLYDKNHKRFKLIDPRGYFGLWDSYYDMGKLLFTLQGFGNIVENSYTISQDDKGGFSIEMSDLSKQSLPVPQVEKLFMSYLENDPNVALLIESDPYWKHKIQLAAATHFIADIPYRLFIDKSPKNAFVCYLLGTIKLNEFYTTVINA